MAQITVGSTINLNGATRLMNATGLKTLSYQTGGPQAAQTNSPSQFTNNGQWYAGQNQYPWLTSGTSASYDPSWGAEPGNDVNGTSGNDCIHAFPNQDAINFLGIPIGSAGDFLYLDGNDNLVIQPLVLTSGQLTTVQAAANSSISGPAYPPAPNAYMAAHTKWLSGGFTSLPMAIAPPFCMGARLEMPFPFVTGMWPALWCLNASGGWPPEIDILECIEQAGLPQTFQLSLHSSTVSGNGGPSIGVTGLTQQAFHDFWVVVYNDFISMFVDGVCQSSWATPTDFQNTNFYLILSYQIAGPGSGWPGPLGASLTSIPPMTVADVLVMTMPATYGSGAALGYIAPSGPAAITFSGSGGGGGTTTNFSITSSPTTVAPGANFTVSGLAGTEWVNVAAYNSSGTKISGDDTPNVTTGVWTLTCSATNLVTGANTIQVLAFSTPAGVSGGTDTPLTITVTVAASTGEGYINGGINLAASPYNLTLPTTDYFGNPIPNSNGKYNIGADSNTI